MPSVVLKIWNPVRQAPSKEQGLKDEAAQLEGFQKNIGTAESALALQETMLGQMNDSMNRIRDLVLAIGGAPLPGDTPEPELYDGENPSKPIEKPGGGSPEIAAYTQEIVMMLENLVDIGNTRSATGEYIFGGTQGGESVITYNEETGLYEISGSDSHRTIQISDSQSVELGVVIGAIFGEGEDNFLNQIQAFVNLANDPNTTGDQLTDAIADALNAIDDTMANINQSLTKIGASMNKVDMAASGIADRQLYNEAMTSFSGRCGFCFRGDGIYFAAKSVAGESESLFHGGWGVIV